MEKNKAISIEKVKLLLVEGKDEENFFQVLLNKCNIQGVQIISSGGKYQFKEKFSQIKITSGFDDLVSLAIVQDADEDAQSRFQSICGTLKSNELKTPKQRGEFTDNTPQTGVFIISDNEGKGSLEDLCLSTVEDSEKLVNECIDPFMSCMKKNSKHGKPKNMSKARLKAFLSTMKEDTSSLGVAAQKGYWNLDSDKLKPILSFLKQM